MVVLTINKAGTTSISAPSNESAVGRQFIREIEHGGHDQTRGSGDWEAR